MVNFLVIRFSSIGDIVLTTPVFRAIKTQIPDSKVYFLTKKKFADLASKNPNIDHVFALDNNKKQLLHEIKNAQIHYIIDLHRNLRTYNFKMRLKLLSFTFNKLNLKKWLLVNFKVNKLPTVHIVDRYLDTLKLFDIQNDHQGLEYYIPDDVTKESISIPIPGKYIVFSIAATHGTKRLPVAKVIEICNNITHPIILLGGEDVKDDAADILKECHSNITDLCGKINLNQSALLIKDATAVITYDTGLMHIASAYKKKIISIWGNTVPEFGMYPYLPHPDSKIFEVNLNCRPCSKIGYKKCPKNHFRCMNEQPAEIIAQTANNWWN